MCLLSSSHSSQICIHINSFNFHFILFIKSIIFILFILLKMENLTHGVVSCPTSTANVWKPQYSNGNKSDWRVEYGWRLQRSTRKFQIQTNTEDELIKEMPLLTLYIFYNELFYHIGKRVQCLQTAIFFVPKEHTQLLF